MSVQAIVCAMALQKVSPAEKLLLLALANYADEDMECWPSQARLAADTCLSERHVRRILAELEDRMMLSRRTRRREDGYRASDVVTLHFSGEVTTSPDRMSPDTMSPDILSDLTGQIEPILPDTVSAPTTLEPSLEPSVEPVGGVGAREPASDWPEGNALKALVAEIGSPWLDPDKSHGLITTAACLHRWRKAGASWQLDVIPVVTGLCSGRRSPISTWNFFNDAVARSIADNRAELQIPEARPPQSRAQGPPSIIDRIAAENAEARRLAFARMDAEHGRQN